MVVHGTPADRKSVCRRDSLRRADFPMRYQQKPGIERRLCSTMAITLIYKRLRRIATVAFALTLATLSQSASYAVDIDALVGFGQSTSSRALYRPETATPLTVYLTGAGIKGEGQLQLIVRSNDRSTTYTRKVTLTEGTIKEARAEGFVFQLEPIDYYRGRSSASTEINIQLLVDGRQVARKTVAIPLSTSADSYNVLALTRNGSGLNFLVTKMIGLFHRHTNATASVSNRFGSVNASPNGINSNASLYVAYSRSEALPVMEQGYDMMDAVALADMPLDNLTDAQISALKGYVRNGGLLIVSGGGDLSRLKAPFYADMLPITVTGTSTVGDLSSLSNRYRTPLQLAVPAALVTGILRPSASVLLQQSARMPLVTSRAYGAGTVVLTAFDYLDPTFRGWSAAPSFWRDLLRTGNDVVSPRGVLASTINAGNNVDLLADALAGSRASSTPGFWTVAIFIGTYLVLLIPISYFVLKRMDKREMAWYTAPVLIASFTLISYMIALSIKGGSLNMNRALVLESQAGSDQFAGYSLMTLYSPRRSTYNVSLSDSGIRDSTAGNTIPNEVLRGQSLTSDVTVEQNGTTILRNLQIGLWDKRSFDLPLNASLGGAIDAAVSMTGGNSARVTVRNRTRFTIRDCSVLDADRSVSIGDLAPGQSRTVPTKLAFGANSDSIKVPAANTNRSIPFQSDSKSDSPDAVRAKLRYAVTQAMSTGDQNNNGYSYGYGELESNFGRVPNIVVGWLDNQLFHPTVDGKVPIGEEVAMVCVHLPAPDHAPMAIAIGYNPFLAEPTLNLEDNLGPGGARSGMMMRGNE